jgi:hypothetical protein
MDDENRPVELPGVSGWSKVKQERLEDHAETN